MKRAVLLLLPITLLLGGCGYNTLQSADEQIKAAWSEVINQCQRRADLIFEPGGDRAGLRQAGKGRLPRRHQREGIERITTLLAKNFPADGVNPNELPDRPRLL